MHAEERHRAILRKVREHGSMRVTDFAAESGVSPATIREDVKLLADRGLVSRVHGGAMLPEDRAETAPAPAREAAAEPPGRREPTLGMIVPSASYYYPDVIKGAREAVAARGARLVLRVCGYDDPGEAQAQARQLTANGIDGLLLATPGTPADPGQQPWYEEIGVPVVLVERRPDAHAPAVDHVVTDHAYGARLAVRHLAGIGRRRIALLLRGSTPTAPWIREGYAAGLAEAGLDGPAGGDGPVYDVGSGEWDDPSYRRPMGAFLDAAAAGRIDAVIVHPENDALGLLQQLRDRELPVPGRIAVVSYDDEVAELADIPLTAVAPSKREVGEAAAELVLRRVAGPGRPARGLTIFPELRVRTSTAAAAPAISASLVTPTPSATAAGG